MLRNSGEEQVDDDLFSLACGPDLRVKKYRSCIVNGVRWHTTHRDLNKKTQNNGVMVQGSHNGQMIDFYGTLKEIIKLNYTGEGEERSVVLFKCDWYKLDGKISRLQNDGYFKSINVGSLCCKDDSLIFATQARRIFYLPDTKMGDKWQVVQTFDHRHLYNVNESDSPHYNAPAYQEDECFEVDGQRQTVSDNTYEKPLNRDDEPALVFEASEIARFVKESNKHVHESDVQYEDDEEDKTLLEYCDSDDDGGAAMEVDSDDE
jgi:hypothetical protein